MATFRYMLLIVAAVVTVHLPDVRDIARVFGKSSDRSADNVILVVADGLRWQEVFRGADADLLAETTPAVRRKYGRASVNERRAALMPFLWSHIARNGQLHGNRDMGSAVRVTNPMKFSYPGYNELLVGYPDARIDRNDFGPNPNVTVFEWLNRGSDFRGRVAVFGTWHLFHDIFNAHRSRLRIGTSDSDALTHAAAMQFLRSEKPRALFVGYGETDDWAHKKRYDRTLDAAHAIDGYLGELWAAAQSMPQYRGRTTLIVVADHGRGRAGDTWTDHGADIGGSDETWLAIVGPYTDAGGVRRDGALTLSQTAATVAAAVGADYHRDVSRAATPVQQAIKR
jgi:hypothetical protein